MSTLFVKIFIFLCLFFIFELKYLKQHIIHQNERKIEMQKNQKNIDSKTRAIFSQRLADLRIKCGLSQKDLGEKIGVSDKTVSGYERTGRVPDIDILITISKELGCSIDYLVGVCEFSEMTPKLKKRIDHYLELVAKKTSTIKLFDMIEKLDEGDRNRIEGRVELMLENEKYAKKREIG